MTRNIHKFERMVKFQNNKLDILKQKMAVKQTEINCLNSEYEQLTTFLQETSNQGSANHSVNTLQQIEWAMIEIQRKVNGNRKELVTANESFHNLLQEFWDQDRRLKSWEKLVDQESIKTLSANNRLEMRHADETYLITRFVGDQS